ncbi:LysR family transcriptional regulator [Thiomonas sp. OC7]|uniref:LysR family transcriptional regulator n=2 Tax=Thiomonas TaxID=32012 RepID=UPI0012A8B456|nr:LysR family transcriptional regulator [Thiomonas sp. OC7]VDY03442.1 putative transcriptional regulator (LysR family) [Thiomonas sp. Bio17B3]VDY09383.1 putative transcriptional regulator (LysR family) [Thiomonas sp. Sup16B3]VDY11691.1 putative transcriptional regulator (LysR family) [Thiomonas sp. OC7]VDY19094.1 putative transcriptional regulator (LysR family) [Thiomonas sp. CB2]
MAALYAKRIMELRQLRYFVTIAEQGSFSRAAERLHISQPPLSTQIKALEDEIGARLLERSNRGVALTAAGAAFFDDIRAVLAQFEHAVERARQTERGDAGTLSIGFVSIADFGILPPTLKSFRARYPQVDVQLHELTTDAQIRELRAAELDLSIGLAPVDEPGLTFTPLLQEPLMLAAPTAHPVLQEGSGAVDLRALAKEPFIVPPRNIGPGLYDLTLSLCQAAGFAPRITQHARQMQTVIGLVSCGMGVALVPASLRQLKRPGVQYCPLLGQPANIELGILQLSQTSNPLRENFIRALQGAAQGLAQT